MRPTIPFSYQHQAICVEKLESGILHDDGKARILHACSNQRLAELVPCVMVGGSEFDTKMARAAEVGAVGVAWGYNSPDLLFAAGASSVATSFSELLVNLGYAEGW